MMRADRHAPSLRDWRTVLDPPGVPHAEAWAALEQLAAFWEPAGAPSLLTPSGAPLEFTFRGGSNTLVYTAEPGPPDAPPPARWRLIEAITAAVGTEPPRASPSAAALFESLRRQPGQRFGCWLGVRQGSGAVSYKWYQEVTPAAHELVRHALDAALPTLDPTIALIPQLVGESLPDGALEFYLRVPAPRPATLHALLNTAGASGQLRLCLQSLAWLAGMPVSQVPERLRLGISYRLAPAQPPLLSLFMHAVQISERNTTVRERLLALAEQLGLDFGRYARATAFLQSFDPPCPLHGLVGLSIEPNGAINLSVGVSPPGLPRFCHT